jgi:hypothetical protein
MTELIEFIQFIFIKSSKLSKVFKNNKQEIRNPKSFK